MVVEQVKTEEIQWLSSCAVGCVKNMDILADLPFLLQEGGFLTMRAKYLGGFRYLLECDSAEEMLQLLQEGKEALIRQLVRLVETVAARHGTYDRPGRLGWLSIRGIYPITFVERGQFP